MDLMTSPRPLVSPLGSILQFLSSNVWSGANKATLKPEMSRKGGASSGRSGLLQGCQVQHRVYSQGHCNDDVWCQMGTRLSRGSLCKLCKCLVTMLYI